MSLSSRAVAVAASTGCPRLGAAARHGWSDTAIAKAKGIVAIAPRLAFVEGQEFERRAVGRGPDDDPALLTLLELTDGRVVRFRDGEADSELLTESDAALADPDVTVILQGVLPGLYGGFHRPDLLVRTPRGWSVGEVKVYLDRAGDTPAHLVQSTATQAAVSVAAGRQHGLVMEDQALIILASSRGAPSVRVLDIAGEAELIDHLLRTSPAPRATTTQMPELAEHRYNPSICEGACALADVCRGEAGSEPGVLWPGDTTAPTYGWKHVDLLTMCEAGNAPSAVQAGWDAARGSVPSQS